jgi:hypothetical protein
MKSIRPVGLVFMLAMVVYGINFLLAEGFNGGADSFTHYQISRYSWNYPDLLLDQWGKPIFTILFSPLAQLGFKAVILGNMALIFLGAWMAYLIAKKLELKRAHWIPFMVLFTPIVAGNAISGLTEMICALFLIGFILLALNQKFIWGSILLSFMPFARSEGFVIIAVVILFFFLTKRMKYLPFLLVGSVVFNFIGWAITGKPLWIFQSNPYMGSSYDDSYGSGPIYHFIMCGVPVFGIGFLLWLWQTWKESPSIFGMFKSDQWTLNKQVWFFLILGTSWAYFLAHTVLWWQGIMASLGLVRVMFVIAVPVALLALKAWNSFKWSEIKLANQLFLLSTISAPFVMRLFPLQEIQIFPSLGVEEQVNVKALEVLEKQPQLAQAKVYIGHPYMNIILERDPYNRNVSESMTSFNEKGELMYNYKLAKSGDLVIWDGHYGPNELHLPSDSLEQNHNFQFIQSVKADFPFITLGGKEYEIRIYKRI